MLRLIDHELLGEHTASLAPWLELAADANKVGFFSWNIMLNRLRWNSGAEERMGFTPGEMSSFDIWRKYAHPADAEQITRDVDALKESKASRLSFSYRFTPPDGSERVMRGVGHCLYDESGQLHGMIGINIDITDQVAAREALLRSEAQLRTIVDTVPDGVVMIDARGMVRGFNQQAEIMFGMAASEVIGRNIAVLMPEEIGSHHDGYLSAYLHGAPPKAIGRTRQLTARRADGSTFPIELNVGEAVIDDDRIFMGFVRDISERVAAAQRLELLRSEYLQSARLTVMGEMAAGLAHELNQPLAAASNYLSASELIAGTIDHEDAAALVDHARSARRSIKLAGDIIQRLRSFVGGSVVGVQDLDLHDSVQQSLALALAGPDRQFATIETDIPPATQVVADPVQLQQLFVNLIRNATEAMRGAGMTSGLLVIRAREEADRVEIRVEDDGPGFLPEMIENRNLPFGTTKGPSNLGLGLSICRRLLDGMDGTLSIENKEQGGASVAITLARGGGVSG